MSSQQDIARKMLPLVQAVAEGKRIRLRARSNGDTGWIDARNTKLKDLISEYTMSEYEWRVEPELFEGWLNIYENSSHGIHPSRTEADANASEHRLRCIHLREVH